MQALANAISEGVTGAATSGWRDWEHTRTGEDSVMPRTKRQYFPANAAATNNTVVALRHLASWLAKMDADDRQWQAIADSVAGDRALRAPF